MLSGHAVQADGILTGDARTGEPAAGQAGRMAMSEVRCAGEAQAGAAASASLSWLPATDGGC